MPYADDEDADDELDERELPDESDFNDDDDDDDEPTATCPHCGGEVYQDTERCPKCGHYMNDSPKGRKPWWIFFAVIVCVLIVLEWVLHDRL